MRPASQKHPLMPSDSRATPLAQDAISESTGVMVASPHPDYLFATLSGSATPYALVHSQARKDSSTHHSDDMSLSVRYLPQWSIGKIVEDSLEAEYIDDDHETEGSYVQRAADRSKILASVQSQVVQEYDKLRGLVFEWLSSDTQEKSRCKNDNRIPVHIDAETIRNASGLVMRWHWRRELGWRGDESADSVRKGKKFEFFAESYLPPMSTDRSTGKSDATVRWKYVWDHESGAWAYGWDSPGTKEKRLADRMKHLNEQVQRIANIRDDALRENGLGYITRLNTGMRIDCREVRDVGDRAQETSGKVDKCPQAETSTPSGAIRGTGSRSGHGKARGRLESASVRRLAKSDYGTTIGRASTEQKDTDSTYTILRPEAKPLAASFRKKPTVGRKARKATSGSGTGTAQKRKFSDDSEKSDNTESGSTDNNHNHQSDEYDDDDEHDTEGEDREDEKNETTQISKSPISFPPLKKRNKTNRSPPHLSIDHH